jgi:hypothetical protein
VARKPTALVQLKIRMREDLRKRIEREADRSGVSLNVEMARRLARSFEIDKQNAELRREIQEKTKQVDDLLLQGGGAEELKKMIDPLSKLMPKVQETAREIEQIMAQLIDDKKKQKGFWEK